uniref:RNA-directed RNA polymerase catalytic subunit n=1 Tax=Old quarry swamp virus TaxID=2485876 RepID=A0A3G3BTM0_9VIRU|nr:PB1 [Old quarry swamp virus]
MDFPNDVTFVPLNNSLLVSSLIVMDNWLDLPIETRPPPPELTDNLGLISALYIYTNTPPMRYGSQGPKVAETILRAYSYNLKKEDKEVKIGPFTIEKLQWRDCDGPFPFEATHGNYSGRDVKLMCMNFVKEHHVEIDRLAEQVVQKSLHRNSDILTKGRQTNDCFTGQSVTASVAYKRMADFFRDNLGVRSTSCLEWIRCFMECIELDTLVYHGTERIQYDKYTYSPETKQRVLRTLIKVARKKIKVEGADVSTRVLNFARSFCSYLKHKERGKKEGRAIASSNMILRMFLHLIEEFHLALGRELQGSTISIGGEEKKAKITNVMNASHLRRFPDATSAQGTEDATKWNECLSPELFGMMHRYLFCPKVRIHLGLPQPSAHGVLFSKIALAGNFLMAIKRVQVGPGPMAQSAFCYNRLDWLTTDINRFNRRTQEWLVRARPLLDDEGYMRASPGMLMGMLNAGSTTLGLLSENYGMNKIDMCVSTLRSSDDSTTLFYGATKVELARAISLTKAARALCSINDSSKKNLYFRKYYAEYTSWYLDNGFLSQFGVETAAIRPQGKNPPDDFYAVAKATATSLQTLTVNHVGAQMRLVLGISGVRRLWRINLDPYKREGISYGVLVLSDGGINLWNSCNCHLEETSMRDLYARVQADFDYLMRIRNPNNPFCPDAIEDISYSKELGCLVSSEIETPRTIFHFIRRSNRTAKNSIKVDMFKQELINSEANKIIKTVIPSTLIKYPTEASSIANNLIAALTLNSVNLDLTPEERGKFTRCIERLKGINVDNKASIEFEGGFDEVAEDF